MMKRFLKVLILLGGLSLFTACTTPIKTLPTYDGVFEKNRDIKQWRLTGKIGLRNHKKGHSAYLNWLQCGETFDIRLTGPFGQGGARLTGNATQTVLQTGDRQTYTSTSPEQLMKEHLGWSLPVSDLLYWVRGIPSPDKHFQANANTPGFSQHQWDISYPKLTPSDNYVLPTKTIAEQTPLKITLLIKHWQLSPNCSPE